MERSPRVLVNGLVTSHMRYAGKTYEKVIPVAWAGRKQSQSATRNREQIGLRLQALMEYQL